MLWALLQVDSLIDSANRMEEKLGTIGFLIVYSLVSSTAVVVLFGFCRSLVRRIAKEKVDAGERELRALEMLEECSKELGRSSTLLQQLVGVPLEMTKHHAECAAFWKELGSDLSKRMGQMEAVVKHCQERWSPSTSSGTAGPGHHGAKPD